MNDAVLNLISNTGKGHIFATASGAFDLELGAIVLSIK